MLALIYKMKPQWVGLETRDTGYTIIKCQGRRWREASVDL